MENCRPVNVSCTVCKRFSTHLCTDIYNIFLLTGNALRSYPQIFCVLQAFAWVCPRSCVEDVWKECWPRCGFSTWRGWSRAGRCINGGLCTVVVERMLITVFISNGWEGRMQKTNGVGAASVLCLKKNIGKNEKNMPQLLTWLARRNTFATATRRERRSCNSVRPT